MIVSHLSVSVRPARMADTPALGDVFQQTWRHAYAGIIPHSALDGMIRRRGAAWWRTAVRSNDGVLALEHERKVVGYATCGRSRRARSYEGEIFELYILPEFQGVGFGEFLFEACRHRLDQRSLRGLIIWCLAENDPAVAFYEQRGGRALASQYERLGNSRLERVAFVWDD